MKYYVTVNKKYRYVKVFGILKRPHESTNKVSKGSLLRRQDGSEEAEEGGDESAMKRHVQNRTDSGRRGNNHRRCGPLPITSTSRRQPRKAPSTREPDGHRTCNAVGTAEPEQGLHVQRLAQLAVVLTGLLQRERRSKATCTLDVYAKDPMQRIYLLNVSPLLRLVLRRGRPASELASDLAAYGLIKNASSFGYVSIANISRYPRNSIVIVPSGLCRCRSMNELGSELLRDPEGGRHHSLRRAELQQVIGPNGLILRRPLARRWSTSSRRIRHVPHLPT